MSKSKRKPKSPKAPKASAPSDAFLRLDAIHKIYQQGDSTLRVLKGVSLNIDEGDSLMIIGPSGAGKSTLLHIMGLLDTPSQGEIWFEGRNLSRLGQGRQAGLRNTLFGFVFQFFHLLPDFNAIENVMMPAIVGSGLMAWRAHRGEVRDRAEHLLERVGLKERLRHRPTQLSGGERQRVAICRALINGPRVLLLDEPTGNVDSKTGREILDQLQELNERERQTLVMVTHDESATARASRVIHLRDGEIER